MHYIIMIMSIINYLYNRTKKTTTAEYSDDTVGGLKKAIMETGLQLNVPLFIKEGEILKIDTRTGEYLERSKN